MKMPHLTVSEKATILDGTQSESLLTGQEEIMQTMNDRWDKTERNLPDFERGPFPNLLSHAAVEEDVVNHPTHYTSHPSGIECIQITEHMGFNMGNALKYIWRADLKGKSIQDMEKAIYYIKREINKRSAEELGV